jgi:hypothetical protein
MIPLKLHTIVVSSTDDVEMVQETVFSKGMDSVAVPRIEESVLLNNYLMQVVDVMHSPMMPVDIYAQFSLISEDMLNAEQIKVLTKQLILDGWTVENSNVRPREEGESPNRHEMH